jgi:REP element-mobilizing transposase RayT
VGGTADHVHVATRLARTVTQAGLLEKIKKTSSAWMKRQGKQYRGFFWQGGYGDFSIGWSQLDDLTRYIDRQDKHHQRRTFQEEYRGLLENYHVEFDERYVWD